MDAPRTPGPGFAPAAGERGMAVWTGVAVGYGVLMVLAFGTTVCALVAGMVYGSDLLGDDRASGPAGAGPAGPGAMAPEPANEGPASGGERALVRTTCPEDDRPPDNVGTPDGPLAETGGVLPARDRDDLSRGKLGVEMVHRDEAGGRSRPVTGASADPGRPRNASPGNASPRRRGRGARDGARRHEGPHGGQEEGTSLADAG